MSDVAFVALTIVVFAVMALVVRGVEHMVGQLAGSDSLGGEQHTGSPGAGAGEGSGDGVAGAGAVGMGVPADGQVVR